VYSSGVTTFHLHDRLEQHRPTPSATPSRSAARRGNLERERRGIGFVIGAVDEHHL